MKSARDRTRAQRLEARVTAEQKTLIEHAAALQGRTVTDFVLTSQLGNRTRCSATFRANEAILSAEEEPTKSNVICLCAFCGPAG
jgi:uncharacterized protein (DUF1778 family)